MALIRAGAAAMQGARRRASGDGLSLSDLSPLVWLDAQNVSAGAATALSDKGIAALALTQPQASMQMQVATSATYGGRRVFALDGGDVLTSASTSAIQLAEGGSMTAILVGHMDITALRCVFANEGTPPGFRIDPRVGGGARSIWSDGTTTITHTGPALTLNTPFLWRAEFRGAAAGSNDEVEHFVNGTSGGAASVANITGALVSGAKTWNFGAATNVAGTPYSGQIALFLLFARILSAPDKATILSRINAYFGTTFAGA